MIAGILAYLPTAVICILLTCTVELIIAVIFKIYNYKAVIAVNVATQIFLHVINMVVFYTGMYRYGHQIFIGTEAVIFILEYLLYSIIIRNKKRSILLVYVLTANLTTLLIGLLTDI